MTRPRHLLTAWPEIKRRLPRSSEVAFFTDFDGTLVPIRPRPEGVHFPAEARRVLASISRRAGVTGVVSGRELGDLRRQVQVPGLWYVGAHGFFLRGPNHRQIALLDPQERRRISALTRRVKRRMAGVEGLRLEAKGASVAVHYRRAGRAARESVRAMLSELLRPADGFHLMAGKCVWEILPNSHVDKATALEFILRRERGSRWRARTRVFYLGDDVTDERVFVKLKGVTVAVGRRVRTRAAYYLRGVEEVQEFLGRLNEALE
jgi:trehalose 6-phosphate phosphatase